MHRILIGLGMVVGMGFGLGLLGPGPSARADGCCHDQPVGYGV